MDPDVLVEQTRQVAVLVLADGDEGLSASLALTFTWLACSCFFSNKVYKKFEQTVKQSAHIPTCII